MNHVTRCYRIMEGPARGELALEVPEWSGTSYVVMIGDHANGDPFVIVVHRAGMFRGVAFVSEVHGPRAEYKRVVRAYEPGIIDAVRRFMDADYELSQELGAGGAAPQAKPHVN